MRFEFAGVEQICNLDQTRACDSYQKEDTSDPTSRRLLLIRRRDGRDENPPRFENLERTGERFSAYGVEDDIDSADLLLKTNRLDVNDLIGTQRTNVINITAERRGNNFGTGSFRKLDRIGTHVTGCTMHQHSFRVIHLSVIVQHLPSCHCDHRNRGGFDVTQSRWLSCDHVGLGESILGLGASELGIGHAKYLIAGLDVSNLVTDALDNTGQVRSKNQRQWLKKHAFPGSHQCIPW